MADWRWRAYDLASGAPAADLRLTSWSCEDKLNDAGDWSATLEPRSAVLDRQSIDATLPGRSLVVPFRDGMPLGGGDPTGGYAGVVWSADLPDIGGSSLLSYFDRQPLSATKAYAGIDQHAMMADLVDWVQANGGNVQVDTSQVTDSTVLRDQTWYSWEQKNVGEAFRQKADNLNGYDFDFRVEVDVGEVVRRLRMWTPRRGRVYVHKQNPVFIVGRNARTIPAVPADGGAMVTEVRAVGAETGVTFPTADGEVRERLEAVAYRTDLLAAGYPRLVEVLDRNDVSDLGTLQAHADGWAYFYGAAPIDEIVLEVDPDDRTWPSGTFEVGDDCMVVIPDDVPWWPSGLQEVRRIVALRRNVDAAGERLQVVTGRGLE